MFINGVESQEDGGYWYGQVGRFEVFAYEREGYPENRVEWRNPAEN